MKRFAVAIAAIFAIVTGFTAAHATFDYRESAWSLRDVSAGTRVNLRYQGAPAAKTVTAALSAADLTGGLITTTGATAPSEHQLPLGTALDTALPGMVVGESFDFVLINTGTGASDDATITVNTGVTIVGNPTVGSLTDGTIISGSGTFRVRKTATATYVVYRLS
jgi:hypothetical protein